MSFNDYYSQDISNKIKAVKRRKIEKGEFQGSFAPYGYKKDPENKNHLIIDEETAPIVRRIFDLYLSGNGILKIAKILNDEGIPSPGERVKSKRFEGCDFTWKKGTVFVVLTNVVYIGTIVGQKTKKINHKVKKSEYIPKKDRVYVENMHEGIIDKKTFETVQCQLKRIGKERKRKYDHSLKGLVYCGVCGAKALMKVRERPKKSGGISKDIYFLCGKKSNWFKACDNGRISEKFVMPYVMKEVKEQCSKIIFSKDDIQNLYEQAKRNANDKRKFLERQIEFQEKEIEKIENKINQMYADRLNGIIKTEDFSKFYNTYQEKKENIIKNVYRLKQQLKETENKKVVKYSYIRKIADKCLNMESPDKELLSRLIDRIEYTTGEGIKIKYKFANYK